MSNVQQPSIGRIVLVYMGNEDSEETDAVILDDNVPFAAQVCYVGPTGLINVVLHDHEGNAIALEGLDLGNPDPETDCHGQEESYATWMPYQVAQHNKTQG